MHHAANACVRFSPALLLPLAFVFATGSRAERINHAGRILGPVPVVATPILFNTAAADAVVSALQIMPLDSPWNEDISRLSLLSNSLAIIGQINSDLATSRRTLRAFYEMNFVLVPDAQPTIQIPFFYAPDESDLDGGIFPNGLYPIPSNLPIETWPRDSGTLTLDEWQRDINNTNSDRHSITVQPGTGNFWETWQCKKLSDGSWQAANGAKFSLASNAIRPAGWTSGDAAGLPMFPALVRYDEGMRGQIEHALRIVVAATRANYIYPANHKTGASTNVNQPAMGQRLRLRADYTPPNTWSVTEKAVVAALKKYGALVADNGNFLSISVCPDDRWAANEFTHLSAIAVTDFEIVQTTGPTGGPRSPGAPTVAAGSDRHALPGETITLNGSLTPAGSGATILWRLYSGPAAVAFGNTAQLATTATFSQPGVYTLMLSGNDTVHTSAYDAIVVRVSADPTVNHSGSDAHFQFSSFVGVTYRAEKCSDLTAGWTVLANNVTGTGGVIDVTDPGAWSAGKQFYRVVIP